MAIEELLQVIVAPQNPLENGPKRKWAPIQRQLGTQLPADFRDFGLHYGSGHFPRLGFRVFNVFEESFCWQVNEQLDTWRFLREQEGKETVPFKVFPNQGGLLPWGADDQASGFFWLTHGRPAHWPVIVTPYKTDRFFRYEMSLTTFLARVLHGQLKTELWRKSFLKKADSLIFVPRTFPEQRKVVLKSLYQLYIDTGNKAGFWAHHVSERGTEFIMRVKSIGGKSHGALKGRSPDFGKATVIVDYFSKETLHMPNHVHLAPELDTFERDEPPQWWRE